MTVAAFLLECEVCHDKMGLLSGAVTSFICFSCAADKIFGTGGKSSETQVSQGRPATATLPSPAIPSPMTAPTPTVPAVPTSDPLPTAYERFKRANDDAVTAYAVTAYAGQQPSPTYGDTGLRRRTTYGGPRTYAESYVDADRLPLTFRCPSCGQLRRWHLRTPPWRNAVCSVCYAERQQHAEGE